MNNYYEANMPDGAKPQQNTNVESVKKFIKDKYVKKAWVNEDEEDPVWLYQSGEWEDYQKKKDKKKEKKEKKKKEKKPKDEKKAKDEKKSKGKEEKPKGADLIDFAGDDGFGDFQDGDIAFKKEIKSKSTNDEFGDLIGGDDGFGDFQMAENKNNDDDFGDFVSSNSDPGHSSNLFSTPTPAAFSTPNNNTNLINNLSNLYNQAPPASDPNNKYAALETMGQPFQPTPSADLFFGMSMGSNNSFGTQQPQMNTFYSTQQPNLTHQHSWSGSVNTQSSDIFNSGPQFPSALNGQYTQPSLHSHHSGYSSHHNKSSTPPPSAFNYNTVSAKDTKKDTDPFGLKATLQQKGKGYSNTNTSSKYTYGSSMLGGAKKADTNAFSGLVSTQWQ